MSVVEYKNAEAQSALQLFMFTVSGRNTDFINKYLFIIVYLLAALHFIAYYKTSVRLPCLFPLPFSNLPWNKHVAVSTDSVRKKKTWLRSICSFYHSVGKWQFRLLHCFGSKLVPVCVPCKAFKKKKKKIRSEWLLACFPWGATIDRPISICW